MQLSLHVGNDRKHDEQHRGRESRRNDKEHRQEHQKLQDRLQREHQGFRAKAHDVHRVIGDHQAFATFFFMEKPWCKRPQPTRKPQEQPRFQMPAHFFDRDAAQIGKPPSQDDQEESSGKPKGKRKLHLLSQNFHEEANRAQKRRIGKTCEQDKRKQAKKSLAEIPFQPTGRIHGQ